MNNCTRIISEAEQFANNVFYYTASAVMITLSICLVAFVIGFVKHLWATRNYGLKN